MTERDNGNLKNKENKNEKKFKDFTLIFLGEEKLSKYEQEGLVPFVVDAVYSMAHAIHNLLHDRCGEIWSKSCFKEYIKGADLLGYIRNVSFKSKITLFRNNMNFSL